MLTLDGIKDTAKRHTPQSIGTWQYCSVLLPLVEKDGSLYVLYEQRSENHNVQPGEVSFPGGGIKDGENAREAALRETIEELGLPESAIEIAAQLDYLISHASLRLDCFLGIIDPEALEKANINHQEVEDFFLVPLAWLLENEPAVYTNILKPEPAPDIPIERIAPKGGYVWRGGVSEVPVYFWPDPETGKERVIWGMTARLTMAFVDLLRKGL